MFDTYSVHQQDRLVPYAKTVNEYKAPTDDSIKLYGDFLQKAREELVEKGRFCSNEVNVTYSIYRDHAHDTTCCHYNIVINGKLLQAKFELSSYHYSDRYEFFTELKQHIVEAISNYVIITIVNTSGKWLYETTK